VSDSEIFSTTKVLGPSTVQDYVPYQQETVATMLLGHDKMTVLIVWYCTPKVMTRTWPWGPTDLKSLFQWPDRYAKTLLGDAQRRERFRNLCKYNIQIFDNYSGMGTGAWTLHIAHKHMLRLRPNYLCQFCLITDHIT